MPKTKMTSATMPKPAAIRVIAPRPAVTLAGILPRRDLKRTSAAMSAPLITTATTMVTISITQ